MELISRMGRTCSRMPLAPMCAMLDCNRYPTAFGCSSLRSLWPLSTFAWVW
jgi:hypothetical protein